MRITKKSIKVLKEFIKENTIGNISNKFNVSYMEIRNNYFKFFKKFNYIKRTRRGYYKITDKGKEKIKEFYSWPKIELLIIKSLNEGLDNISILKELDNKFNFRPTTGALFTRIYRLGKVYDIKLRHKNHVRIPDKIDGKLAKLLGLIMSDGSVSGYQISFCNKNISLINNFKELFISVFNISSYFIRDTQVKGARVISFTSIDIVKYLHKTLDNKNNLPNELINSNYKIKKAFLQGLYSGDGCVTLSISYHKKHKRNFINSKISLGCAKQNINKQVKDILGSLRYNSIFVEKGLDITQKESVIKYGKEIGFIKNCYIFGNSKRWKGFTKNQVLNFVINDLFSKDNKEYYYNLSKNNKEIITEVLKKRIKICCLHGQIF